MAPLTASPTRRTRPASKSGSSNVVLKDSRAMRAALNRLSYLRTRPASTINPAFYAAQRDARARANSPPPPRIPRRRKITKENVAASASAVSVSTRPPAPAVARPPVTTVAHAPWMRQPLADVAFVSTPEARQTLTAGSRVPRAEPLSLKGLWIDGVEPPPRDPEATPHLECSVCKQVKMCPVTSSCGHSHCYPCVRMALEYTFNCPSCRTVMTSAPFRCWAEEHCIALAHPDWNNTARVTYDFDGLVFPRLM
ncbi:hypothetical protein C8R47DRAFT_1210707 [Mycena vitilis]|nr:hypothetical protein C8R47DRAFT_1210707 [Mycena vitilis]